MTNPAGTTTIAALRRACPAALLPVGEPDLDTPIRAVHISELVDPTLYLDGGELLLTTGMALPIGAAECGAYVRRLADRGVAALALGLGPVYADVPTVLVRTCERVGLPLFNVPPQVPFQQVTRAFWTSAGGAQERELQETLLSQHRLVIAAAAPEPVPQILAQLARAVGGHAVVTDVHGRPRTMSAPEWPYDPGELQRAVVRLRHAGPRTAATFPLGPTNAVLHPVTSDGDVVSYLAVTYQHRPTPQTRNLILMTLALLGMEATHRRTSLSSRRPARAAVAHLVDRGRGEAVPDLAAHLGLEPPPDRVRIVVARGAPATALDVLLSVLPDHADRWWGTTSELGAWVMLSSRLPEPDPGRVTAALAEAAYPVAVVIGPVVTLRDVHAVRTTLEARARAVAAATAAAWRPDDAIPFVTREWAEATLAPLRPLGEGVVATVAAYLRHQGSWQRTASTLGLHRNSVRSHIARAEVALGERLSDPDTAARLWLALRETSVTDGPAGRR